MTEDGAVVVAAPGARAPHAWVSYAGERRSTIDLFEGRLTLLTGPRGDAWRDVATPSPRSRCRCSSSARTSSTPLVTSRTGTASGDDDAVLVRPDGHVAWRLAAGDARALQEAIATTLGRQPAVTV